MKYKFILIAVGASVLLTGLWYVALWGPQSGNLTEAREEHAAAKQRADGLQVELTRLKALEANKEQLELDRAALAAAIPDEDQLDTFVLKIHELAKGSGISFVSVSPAPPAQNTAPGAVTAAGPTPISLQMQVTGDYHAILRFMDAVRDSERLVVVDTLSLSAAGEGDQLSASIGGRMFLKPPVAATPAGATPTVGSPQS